MNKIIVLEYEAELLSKLKNRKLIVKTDSFENIEQIYGDSRRNNDIVAMFVQQPFASVSQICFNPGWENIPIILKVYSLGDYHTFMSMVNDIRHLNIRIYLSSKSDNSYTDLKIMASMGIDCGIWIDSTLDDEKFMDLASYNYISPVRHASIEPFDNILKNLYSEDHVTFDSIYLTDKTKFIEIGPTTDLSLLECSADDDFEHDFLSKMESHYKHFMVLDKCSKCQAYKICNHKLMDYLVDCEQAMAEVYEYAEMRSGMDINESTKTVCQL